MPRSPMVRLVLVCAGVVGFYLLGVGVRQLSGSCVDIRNTSKDAIRNVSVTVDGGGKTYEVPNLAPGDHRRVYVKPSQKSSVTMSMTDARNRQRNFTVFGEAHPGDCGVSMVTIQPGQNTESDE